MDISPEKALEVIYNLDDLAYMIDHAVSLWKEWHDEPASKPTLPEGIGVKLQEEIVSSDKMRADISNAAKQLVSIMSQKILNAAINKIKLEESRLTKVIKDGQNTLQDIEKEKEIARREICEILSFMKEHHSRTLPGEYLNNLFRSFHC
jgi:DNA gyrase/topoisomerase IV subunit A